MHLVGFIIKKNEMELSTGIEHHDHLFEDTGGQTEHFNWPLARLHTSTTKCFISQEAIAACITAYTGCPRRNVKYFGRVFLELNYTDITQNTYIQS